MISMMELRSPDSIRNLHSIRSDMSCLPVTQILMDQDPPKNWEALLEKEIEKAEALDGVIEVLVAGPSDPKLNDALCEELRKDRYTSLKESMSFSKTSGFAYHAQREKELVDMLVNLARKDFEPEEAKGLDEEGVEWLQAGWEVNPNVARVSVDGAEADFRFQDAFNCLARYHERAEHEFYKQGIVPRLNMSFMLYHFAHWNEDAEQVLEGETTRVKAYSKEPKKLVPKDIELEYREKFGKLERVLDFVYYTRALDYLRECTKVKEIMNGSQFTQQYALLFVDLKDNLFKI